MYSSNDVPLALLLKLIYFQIFNSVIANALKSQVLNTFINSLEEQDPGSNTKSSIAMSPWELLPRIPSNVTYNHNKRRKLAFKIGTKSLSSSTALHHQFTFLSIFLVSRFFGLFVKQQSLSARFSNYAKFYTNPLKTERSI